MKIFDKLKQASSILERSGTTWAVCGGVAACLYRETPRYTGDIDFCLSDSSSEKAIDIAKGISIELGYKPIIGFVTDQYGRLLESPALIICREDEAGAYVGIDFLLPVLPWIGPAIERAQMNKLDYGFAALPTIVPEDLIVAKLIAFQGTPERVQDLDDVRSILKHMKDLDTSLIRNLCDQYKVTINKEMSALL